MQAADRFHCPPWELLERGRGWVETAITTLTAERKAEHQHAAREARKARQRRQMGG